MFRSEKSNSLTRRWWCRDLRWVKDHGDVNMLRSSIYCLNSTPTCSLFFQFRNYFEPLSWRHMWTLLMRIYSSPVLSFLDNRSHRCQHGFTTLTRKRRFGTSIRKKANWNFEWTIFADGNSQMLQTSTLLRPNKPSINRLHWLSIETRTSGSFKGNRKKFHSEATAGELEKISMRQE